MKKEHERFFFRDISASVHAAESRANPREQRIAEPLTAFTVPLLWITITVSLQEGSYANESAWIDPRMASTVVGDITRVRQVLLNVLNNAIKFTSSGEIYLQVEPSVDLDNMIHFCVEDTGLGIQLADFGREFIFIGRWMECYRVENRTMRFSLCGRRKADEPVAPGVILINTAR